MTAKERKDVYEIITAKVLEQLDKGVVPWHKPWQGGFVMPYNLKSKKAYRGINVFLLSIVQEDKEYRSKYWLTYRQAKELEGNVIAGEKASCVVFWKWIEKKTDELDDEDEPVIHRYPILRYYNVFNLCQCENIDEDKLPEDAYFDDVVLTEDKKIEQCDEIMKNYFNRDDAPKLKHGGHRACFKITSDVVQMPPKNTFENAELYYSVAFHEMIHSTGVGKRLNRPNFVGYADDAYSKEELVAEMGAAMLCGVTHIEKETIENTVGYIDHWRKQINDDKKLVVCAAAKAQKASDYVIHYTDEANGEQ